MRRKNNKGFSLIELIIAIAILVILTGLLTPQFVKYIEKSREAKDMQTLDAVYTAVQGALADEAAYKAVVKEIGTEGKYEHSLEDILREEKSTAHIPAFSKELESLLGTDSDFLLTSKKADGGKVYVLIQYTFEGGGEDPGNYGGLEVAVYSGDEGSRKGSLDAVGKGAPSEE